MLPFMDYKGVPNIEIIGEELYNSKHFFKNNKYLANCPIEEQNL